MENCLVTKLKATVNNNGLEYLDYLHINVHQVDNPNANNFSISVLTDPNTKKMVTTGSGHFTDGTLQEDRGKEARCSGSGQKFSNGNYQLLIPLTGIVNLGSGTGAPTSAADWQVDGLNYERLLKVNTDILTSVIFPSTSGVHDLMEYTKKVTNISFVEGEGNMQNLMAAMVDAPGRTSGDITFNFGSGSDIYSSGGATRKLKNVVPGTSFSVYNSAGTELLYTALKTGGVWQFTLA